MTPPPSTCTVGRPATQPVEATFALAQLVLFVLCVACMLASTAAYAVESQRFGRLGKRSIEPVLLGGLGGAALVLTRCVYDFVGREFMPCYVFLILFYLHLPVCVLVDITGPAKIAILQEEAQQAARGLGSLRSGHSSMVIAKTSSQEPFLRRPFLSWWHFSACTVNFACVVFGQKPLISAARFPATAHGMVRVERAMYLLLISPCLLALFVRVATGPAFVPRDGCTGCGLVLTDFVIATSLLFVYAVAGVRGLARARASSNPFGSFEIALGSMGFAFPVLLVMYALAFADPGSLMQTQTFDWFVLENITTIVLHVVRAPLQVLQARRAHVAGGHNVRLVELLEDKAGALLFENALALELASENLLFWRQGIKWKIGFDKDLEYSQQMARVICRTFFGRHAQLPINVSSTVGQAVESRFKLEKVVSRTVFDDALIEVYRLMEDGCFPRFLRSKPFAEYKAKLGDFSEVPTAEKPGDMSSDRVVDDPKAFVASYVRGL